jgi:carbon-monoxide dehydrogenase catalytic subunit
MHIEFHEPEGLNVAKKILREAIENFPNRRSKVLIPSESSDTVVGFSHETINYLLGGLYRASYRPLNDNIINGRIRGIAGVVGCKTLSTGASGVSREWLVATTPVPPTMMHT